MNDKNTDTQLESILFLLYFQVFKRTDDKTARDYNKHNDIVHWCGY